MRIVSLAVVALFALCLGQSDAQRQVICYIASWGPDVTSKVDTKLCSTFVIAFATIDGTGKITVPTNINSFLKLKTTNSKLILSLGGGTAGVAGWRSIANSATTRSVFAQNCLSICRQYNLDGVDIDWEFPDTADRTAFTALHQSVYSALNPAGLRLTTAVSAGNWLVNSKNVYDIPALSNYVYGFNLMTYNIHMDEEWDRTTGVNFNAPKMSSIGDSLDQGIKAYLNKGAPASKVFVGVPFYARTYRLTDRSRTSPGSPFVVGYQKSDPVNNVPAYFRYCARLSDSTWIKNRVALEDSPYMYKGDLWTSYEDTVSIARKAQLANSTNYNLGGVMVWAIHQDDIDSVCGSKQPLLKALNNAIGRPVLFDDMDKEEVEEAPVEAIENNEVLPADEQPEQVQANVHVINRAAYNVKPKIDTNIH